MITDDTTFWNSKALTPAWQEYILPGRTEEEFSEEGKLQVMRFTHLIPPDGVVIDYGCGVGRMTEHLKPLCRKVIGIDVSSEYIKKAIERVPGVLFLTVDRMKGVTEIADFLISIMVMQHNSKENREIIIKNIHSLLKVNGEALISFPRVESEIYQETPFVHKFSIAEVEEYGKMFRKSVVVTGDLVNYKNHENTNQHNEYFLHTMR